ncbi:hypothetical protein QBC35DRAFT_395203 [Podospora australis]|uniref:Uncharacterized protein n=1 Tax=Podospora australis TaxID=1536484 RepID=A0AAN6WJ68_9PEZI|nr:hypothetical protein QBC35DRAFT_395203 [Podospora australis]
MTAPSIDVGQLVAQMQDTLTTIHTTLASLNTTEHDAKLDELEEKRDKTIKQLLNNFSAESEALAQRRKATREEIAERRRIEDEERERRRRQEDEELAERERLEDEARDGKLLADTNDVEEETDNLMIQVEEEAQKLIEEGEKKLKVLEEKRRELNHLIEEELKSPPIPSPPRRSRRGSGMPSSLPPPSSSIALAAAVAESKAPEQSVAPSESVNNPEVKALEPELLQSTPFHTPFQEHGQYMPQADMNVDAHGDDHDDGAVQHSETPRPISRHERPLLVQPVISRSGDIVLTQEEEQQARVYTPVERIGVLTQEELDSAEKKLDITWWENKRREEAEEALRAEELARDRGQLDANPLSVQDFTTPGEVHEPVTAGEETVHDRELHLEDNCRAVPLGQEDRTEETTEIAEPRHDEEESQLQRESEVEEVHERAEDTVNNNHPEISPFAVARASLGTPEEPDEHDASFDTTPHGSADRQTHDQAADLEAHINPADIPLPPTANRESFGSEDISFESAQVHHNHPDSWSSVLTTQATATPEHHFSEEEEPTSAYSHSNGEDEEPYSHKYDSEHIISEAANVALPPGMDDSCSLSDHSVADHAALEHHSPEHRAEIYAEDDEDVEAIIPLERVASRCDGKPDLRSEDHDAEAHLQHPSDHDDLTDGQRSPMLETIHENDAVQKFDTGLGIHDHHPEHDHDRHEGDLASTEEHDDNCGCPDEPATAVDEEQQQNEDRIRQTDIYMQPFRTAGTGGPLVGDGDVPQLHDADEAGGSGLAVRSDDAEPDLGMGDDRGPAGDYPVDGVLSEPVDVGLGAAVGESIEGVKLIEGVEPVQSAHINAVGEAEKDQSAEQLRRASMASSLVEMEDEYTTTVHGEDGLFDEETEGGEVEDIEETYLHVDEDGAAVSERQADRTMQAPDLVHGHPNEAVAQESDTQVQLDDSEATGPAAQETSLEVTEPKESTEPDVSVAVAIATDPKASVLAPSPLDKMELDEAAQRAMDKMLPPPTPTEQATLHEAEVRTPTNQFFGPSAQDEAAMFSVRGHLQPEPTVPAIAVVSPDRPLRTSSMVSEVDDFFDDGNDEEYHHEPEATGQLDETHAVYPDETHRASPETLTQQHHAEPEEAMSSSTDRGLSDSHHNPERPQTPEHQVEDDFTPRDVTNGGWHHEPSPSHKRQDSDSSPQSVRSQSTISSGPPSPDHSHLMGMGDSQDPVIRGLVSTRSPSYHTGRPRGNSSLTDAEYNPGHHTQADSTDANKGLSFLQGPLSRWHQRTSSSQEDPDSNRSSTRRTAGGSEGGSSNSGSLFQRMRSVFEQQSDNHNTSSSIRPVSTGGGLWGGGGPVSGKRGSKTVSDTGSGGHGSHRQRHSSTYSGQGYRDVGGDDEYEKSANARSGLLTGEN